MRIASLLALVSICSVVTGLRADEGSIELFNGRNFTGWTYYLADPDVKMEDVWSVKNGVLYCKGDPRGYLRTEKDYENYHLTLEWRWPEGTEKGNSGVLVHTTTPNELGVWPKSLEAQLAKDNAGDFWVIGTTIEIDNPEGRIMGRRHLNLTDDSEKPVGQWNTYDVICRGDEVIVKVNGELVNHARKVSQTRGAICLQSEGAPIEFRNIRLKKLD